MKNSCLRPIVLATCALTLMSAALAQSSTLETADTPQLIIKVRTNIADQGAPTLDILDLERFIVNQLEARQVNNVLSSAATTVPRPPAPKTYLGILSVDAMHAAERPFIDEHGFLQNVIVVGVDLSLDLHDLGTGKVVGTVHARAERSLSTLERDDINKKRVAIYAAADRIADLFVGAVEGGDFGNEPKILLPPPLTMSNVFPRLVSWTSAGDHWQWPLMLVISLPISAIVLAACAENERNKMIEKAEAATAIWIDADGCSEAACEETARTHRTELLERRDAIEEATAARRLRQKELDEENAAIASVAASRSKFKPSELQQILRDAEEWDYRCLQGALRQKARRKS